MREVKNNVEIGKVQKLGKKNSKSEKTEPNFEGELEGEKNVKDFSNPKAETLGRSAIKTDNIKEDVSFGMANPKLIAEADRFFEIAYKQLLEKNDPCAYEKASSMSAIFAKELA